MSELNCKACGNLARVGEMYIDRLCPRCQNTKHNNLRKQDLDTAPKLDSNVEEALKRNYEILKLIPKGYHRKQKNGCIVLVEDILNERLGRIKGNTLKLQQAYTDMQKEIKRKDKSISELNEMLEITVIAEMLDLIKNGEPIPLTRKELQSKLDKIETMLDRRDIPMNDIVMLSMNILKEETK